MPVNTSAAPLQSQPKRSRGLGSAYQFTPEAPGFWENPYPHFRRLQDGDPVHWSSLTGHWYLTRHADVNAALGDARLARLERQCGPFSIPALHGKLRAFLNPRFTRKAVAPLRPRVQEIADELIDPVAATGQIELMGEFAFSLPLTVIGEVLGVPNEDRLKYRQKAHDLLESIGVKDPEKAERGVCFVHEMVAYFQTLVEERRRRPREDLTSRLLATQRGADGFTDEEIVGTCIMLLFAGYETTKNLLGNAVLALLRHPDQLDRLLRDAGLMPSAIQEFLRYEGNIQAAAREALEDVEYGGKTIRRGESVWLVLGAANRDPERFPDPDRFDITRNDGPHLAFGYGAHRCLGEQLVRLETEVAIESLFRRLPDLALPTDRPPAWHKVFVVHSLDTLHLTFSTPVGADQAALRQ